MPATSLLCQATTGSHKLDVLRVHCEALGRPFEAIEQTVIGPAPMCELHPMAMPPEELPAFLEQLEELGIDHFIAPVVDRRGLNWMLDEVRGRFALMEA